MRKYQIIIKKEIMENWTNIEDIYFFNYKGIKYYLIKWYYEHKKYKYDGKKRNYVVEELEDERI